MKTMRQSKFGWLRISEVVNNMMRTGKSLGMLNWKTDTIHLMRSVEAEKDKKFLDKIKKGNFIVEKN